MELKEVVEKPRDFLNQFFFLLIDFCHEIYLGCLAIYVVLCVILENLGGDAKQYMVYFFFSVLMVLTVEFFASLLKRQEKEEFDFWESVKELSSLGVLTKWGYFTFLMAHIVIPMSIGEQESSGFITLNNVVITGNQYILGFAPYMVWLLSRGMSLDITDYDLVRYSVATYNWFAEVVRGEKPLKEAIKSKNFARAVAITILVIWVLVIVIVGEYYFEHL